MNVNSNDSLERINEKVDKFGYIFKVCSIGDNQIGKSSVLIKYSDNFFWEDSYIPTIGADFKLVKLKIGQNKVILQ
jgi:GTPase SAR1 family protein